MTVEGPSEPPFAPPGGTERRFFATAHQVLCFVQKDCRPFRVVDRDAEKLRIQRHYFKGKIRGCISLVVPDIAVPPIICPAKDSQMFEDKGLAIKPVLLEDSDRFLHLFALVRLESVGTNHERDRKSTRLNSSHV